MSTVTRYVWVGDQVLWEMRSPGADGQNLENTTASGAAAGQSHLFGRVSYLHAGGIDRPLTIWKEGVGSVLPHQNWRGLFTRHVGLQQSGRGGDDGELRDDQRERVPAAELAG